MEPNLDANRRQIIKNYQTRSFRARVIPYGSYTETVAMRALVLIGLAMLGATTVSILVAFAIL
jgi:hypothetical protein